MHSAADYLILSLGIVGSLALLGGCIVVAGYLLCAGLPRQSPPKERRSEMSAGLNLFPW